MATQIEPAGLDEFLASNANVPAQQTLPAAPSPELMAKAPEPTGLDEFLGSNSNAGTFQEQSPTEKMYGTPSQQAITALEGAGRGVAGPLAPLAEESLGVDPRAILARQNTNPLSSAVGEAAGLGGSMLTGTGEGALAAKLGTKAVELMGLGGKSATLASKIGSMAADNAVQSMLVAGSDEASRMMINDPNTSAETALVDTGLAGAIGAGIGGGLGVVSPLFKGIAGDKISQMVEDFKGRIHDHVVNPDPVAAMTDELSNYHSNMKSLADDVYGPSGLKSQDIAKAIPETKPEMMAQSRELSNSVSDTIDKMANEPNRYPQRLVGRLTDDLTNYQAALDSSQTGADIFNATQDLKQKLQGYAKFDKMVKPVDDAYDFVSKAKTMSHDFRTALEDPSVWGKAAERQQAINTAFRDYMPALQDFEKRFTTKVSGEPEVDAGKINTYLNQLGKPNAEIKQKMLQNFIDASDKYKSVINQSHINLGLDAPNLSAPLNVTQSTLGKKTTGAKLADIFINKGLSDAGGKTIGAAVGASVGHSMGMGGIGALVGEHALGPFFNSVLPAIAKPMLESVGNPAGLKSAIDYNLSVAAGNHAVDRGMKNLFNGVKPVITESMIPSVSEKTRLDKKLKEIQTNPEAMTDVGGDMAHYLPNHATALGQSTATAVNYLNSLRPTKDKASPLDSTPVISPTAKAKYENALSIAQQPMLVIEKMKAGRLTLNDIEAVQTMFPSLYKRLSSKLVDQVMLEVSKGKQIPYKLKSGISMFIGQPLDSTMKPEAIQSAQMVSNPQQQQPQPNPAVAGGRKKGSPKALSKFGQMYQTPTQAAAADKSSRE